MLISLLILIANKPIKAKQFVINVKSLSASSGSGGWEKNPQLHFVLPQLMLKSRRAGKRLSPVITGSFLRERLLLAPLSPIV